GITVPVILGGAALTRRYVDEDLKSIYKGSLYYAGDAFAGLHTMDKLVGGNNGEQVIAADLTKAAAAGVGDQVEDVEDRVGGEAKLGISKRVKPRGAASLGDTTHTTRSAVRTDVAIPPAPFY